MDDDDRAAVMSAVFSQLTPSGKRVAERMSLGEQQAVTDELLVAIREEWETAGRPIVHPSSQLGRDLLRVSLRPADRPEV